MFQWQENVWQSLQQASTNQHLPHALLFTGEDGCGNEQFVQALAKYLLCLMPTAAHQACGTCRSCQVFTSQAHPDYLMVGLQDEKQAIVIDQIRELNYFLSLSRSYSPRRVVVIYPAERMNINSANSLLKSLEEPAADTHILLLTSQPALLLATIRSRCQILRLPVPSAQTAKAWLGQHSLQHDADMLLTIAHGRPLAALALDQTDQLEQRRRWLEHLGDVVKGRANLVEISANWEKFDKVQLLDWQLDCTHMLIKHAREWLNAPRLNNYLPNFRDFSEINQKKLWSIQAKLIEQKKIAIHPLNPRLFVESMLMLWQVRS